MISDKEIDDYVRSQPENVTEHDIEIPVRLSSETRKLYIRKVKELEAEYNDLPYMLSFMSVEQERANSEKRIELYDKIQSYKNLLSE